MVDQVSSKGAAIWNAISTQLGRAVAILPAHYVDGVLHPLPVQITPGKTVWHMAAKSARAADSLFPRDFTGPVIIVDSPTSDAGVPVLSKFDHETQALSPASMRICVGGPPREPTYALTHHEPQPVKPKRAELIRTYAVASRAHSEAANREGEAVKAAQAAERVIAQNDERVERRNAVQLAARKVKALAFAEGRSAETAAYDAEVVALNKAIEQKQERVTAAEDALPTLRSRVNAFARKREEEDGRCKRAAGELARDVQKDAMSEVETILEQLADPLAKLAALSEIMSDGGIEHLAEADRLLEKLRRPFVMSNGIDLAPTWVKGQRARDLPGIAEARAEIEGQFATYASGEARSEGEAP